jgi:hypothetical protein
VDEQDQRFKDLMQELGNAINESLWDSDKIAAAIGEIRRAGYDVFLVLEATIGFNKRELDEESGEVPLEPNKEVPQTEPPTTKWTNQDKKFFRALKISPD